LTLQRPTHRAPFSFALYSGRAGGDIVSKAITYLPLTFINGTVVVVALFISVSYHLTLVPVVDPFWVGAQISATGVIAYTAVTYIYTALLTPISPLLEACIRQRCQSPPPASAEKVGDDNALILPLEFEASEADSSCDSVKPQQAIRSVVFLNVIIREYSVTIGDHPCCTMGCPLSLDWDYLAESITSLDVYEAQRSPRRSRQQLRTTAAERAAAPEYLKTNVQNSR
jgi:hypothetical protein